MLLKKSSYSPLPLKYQVFPLVDIFSAENICFFSNY